MKACDTLVRDRIPETVAVRGGFEKRLILLEADERKPLSAWRGVSS